MKKIKQAFLLTVGGIIPLLLIYSAHLLIVYLECPKDTTPRKDGAMRAIVVGATSGMGRQVAKLLAKGGYQVGLVGRRSELLESLQEEIHGADPCRGIRAYTKRIDVSEPDETIQNINDLIEEMGGLDLMLISVTCLGEVMHKGDTVDLDWHDAKKFLHVDARGFWVVARTALKHFEKQNYGHLAAISSIDSQVGSTYGPEYSGAKAFIARFLDGTRNRLIQKRVPVHVTEIIPGPVNVERCNYSSMPQMYWVAEKEEAAQQIYDALIRKVERVYVTKRWKLMSLIFSVIPDWLYRRIE